MSVVRSKSPQDTWTSIPVFCSFAHAQFHLITRTNAKKRERNILLRTKEISKDSLICQVSSMFRKKYLSKSSNKTYRFRDSCITSHTVAQSICTHYSSLSGRPDIFYSLELKKKIRSKNTGSLLFKKRRGQAASSLFE